MLFLFSYFTKYTKLFEIIITLQCSKKGFNVQSFGSGNHVKLPGPSLTTPNIYDFNTTYDFMYKDLAKKDRQLYPIDLL